MEKPFWHVRDNFLTVTPKVLVEDFWIDDELNRRRSLSTFSDESQSVNEGLALYIEPIQQVLSVKVEWQNDNRRRSSIAMLIHAFNTFLARRHLLAHGYIAEARHFSRSTYEALCQSLAFADNEDLANKFYAGRQINPREIHNALSTSFSDEKSEKQAVYKQFSDPYNRLSNSSSHPTLESFSFRTAADEIGIAGLRRAVPEEVVFGGLLQDDFGRIWWQGLARGIGESLATVHYVVRDVPAEWVEQSREYRVKIEQLVAKHDAELDEA